MKKNIIYFSALYILFFISTNRIIADTIDHWQFYRNDSLVASFTLNSENKTLVFDADSIRETDSISVRYFKDALGSDCTRGVEIIAEIKQKAPEVICHNDACSLGFSLYAIYLLHLQYQINSFYFNYFELNAHGIKEKQQLICTLQFLSY